MIKFDLVCENEHIFEASFDDSSSFEKQKKKKLIECPLCSSSNISKSVMAPNISNKSSSSIKINREKNKLFSNYNKQINKIKSEIEKNFTYVGKKFPEEARKIHYGEVKDKPIYGEATEKESQELVDEGISLVRLPFSKKEKIKN
tara:strand:- start:267 stop:701 length:435 start_codon:yes stop_codon:yes gene_type:complete